MGKGEGGWGEPSRTRCALAIKAATGICENVRSGHARVLMDPRASQAQETVRTQQQTTRTRTLKEIETHEPPRNESDENGPWASRCPNGI